MHVVLTGRRSAQVFQVRFPRYLLRAIFFLRRVPVVETVITWARRFLHDMYTPATESRFRSFTLPAVPAAHVNDEGC